MVNQRTTKQKHLIHDILLSEKDHLTGDQVFEIIRQKNHKIGRATVFRNLNALVKNGEIGYIPVVDGAAYFDYCNHEHYHFKCNQCKKLYDTPIVYQKQFDTMLNTFSVQKHELIFYGLCQTCTNKLKH